MNPDRELTEVERLLTEDQRRLTVDQHAAFRESLATPRQLDEIDELVEEIRAAEFEEKGARP